MNKCFPILLVISLQANLCLAQSKDEKDWLERADKIRQVFDLAKDPRIRTELEIVNFQVKELEMLKAKYTDRVKQIGEETKSLSSKDAEKLAAEMWKENQISTVKEIEQILLPHQMKRLNQIARQRPIKFVSRGDRFRMYIVMANRLDLSDAEIESFKKNVMKEKQEYEKRLKELMKETDKAVFKHLPKKARAKISELFGEIY